MKEFNCTTEYDKLAAMYDHYYAPTWPFDDNIQGLVDFLKTWPGGDKILEIGIGTGNVAGKLYLEGYHNIVGVDASEKMTERLKYKCPKAKVIIQKLDDIEFSVGPRPHYDWILMVGGIIERVEHKEEYFQKIYDQSDEGMLIFIDIENNLEYVSDVDPDKDLCYQFFNEKRNVDVTCNYRQLTPSHHVGTFHYIFPSEWIGAPTGGSSVIHYDYSLWEITQDDMIALMQLIGFKYNGLGMGVDTGYHNDVLVFQK